MRIDPNSRFHPHNVFEWIMDKVWAFCCFAGITVMSAWMFYEFCNAIR